MDVNMCLYSMSTQEMRDCVTMSMVSGVYSSLSTLGYMLLANKCYCIKDETRLFLMKHLS